MPEPEDSDLIRELLRAGEHDKAFEYIYKYFDWLRKISVPITEDEDESKDIIQNVFFKVLLSGDQLGFTERVPFKYYLARSVINGSISYRKKRKRIAELLKKYESPTSGIEFRPDTILELKALERVVQDGIESLSTRKRECYLMSRHDGLTYKKIAKHFNITEKAVEQNISGALRELREHMQNYLRDRK
jgi:RNA polymerase sigma-70 factor (ECF subfamily)